ncbi:MAG: PKD domain-containing protein [Bacteroidales bacterium]|nr:PKD domain-containing protein [Bacteroidales bacterium]
MNEKRKYYYLLIIVISFFPFFEVYSQNCNIISKANDIIPDGLCAPVTVQWEITYRGVNDGGTPVEIQVNWDDGTIEDHAAINTNPALQEWSVIVNHIYPPGGNRCNYNPSATLMVNGVLCTSTIQVQNITVWDTDDENGGNVEINPQVFPVCFGNDAWVVFDDVTLFNCVPPDENDNPNVLTRWTQWVYGTDYTINNVEVDGGVQAYAYPGNVEIHPGSVTGPTPPNVQSLPIYVPNTAQIGEFFEVTLNYWNYCNPYPTEDPVTATAIILIVPYPDATINPAGPYCQTHGTVFLSAATGGGTWSGTGITNSSTGAFRPSIAGPGNHTITYTVTDGNGCVGTDTEVITVYENPSVDVLPGNNLEVCPGDNLNLDGNPTEGDGSLVSQIWTGNTGPLSATNVQTPVFNTNTQGNYNLTYSVTDNNGCTASESIVVAVNPVTASIIPNPAEVCAGENLLLDGNPSGGTGTYTVHVWTGDVANISSTNTQTTTFNSNIVGTYNFNYNVTDNNGCFGSDAITVTVFENPVANAGVDDSICGNIYPLTAVQGIGIGQWTQTSGPGIAVFDNAGNAETNVTVNLFGSYELTWTEVNGPGCSDAATITIVFLEQPFSNAGPGDNICGLSYPLDAVESVGNGSWHFISGAGNAVFTSPFNSETNVSVDVYGSYLFRWIEDNGNGCIDSADITINFDLVPVPAFSPIDTTGCPPFAVDFVNQSSGGVSYSWDFGDGAESLIENPSHTFTNTGTNDVVYTIWMVAESTFGCKDSISHNLTVHPLPQSNFNNDAVPGCSPVEVNFTNTSIGATHYEWIFGDGDTAFIQNPTHLFYNQTFLIQYFEVQLVAFTEYNCPDTSNAFVTVYPNPDYQITANPDSACHPAGISFSTYPGGSSYFWDYGEGTTENGGNNAFNIYTNVEDYDQTYTITLVTESFFGCLDTSTVDVVIHPKPDADFVVDVTTGCTAHEVTISNNSEGADNYFWDFGDDSTSDTSALSFTHLYISTSTTPVTYYLRLTATNSAGCQDTVSRTIIVYPEVFTDFAVEAEGCSPINLIFTNHTVGAVSYQWDFGDGGSSTTISPIHTYVNNSDHDTTFIASLIATSAYNCKDTLLNYINIHPTPEALFAITENSGCTPFSLEISNASVGADYYNWNFGDGITDNSSEEFVYHTYTNTVSTPNMHTVNLEVENQWGCTDAFQQIVYVYPAVNAAFISDTAGCHPFPVHFLNQSYGGDTYFWVFGDGSTSNIENPIHVYENITLNDKVYNMGMAVQSVYGCRDTSYSQITVYPQPVAEFTPDPVVQMFPDVYVSLNNQTNAGYWDYFWDFDDGTTSNLEEPAYHAYESWGEYEITLVATGAHCSDSVKHTVFIVAPRPVASFGTSASGCPPFVVEFENNSQFGSSYLWDFGDGIYSSDQFPVHTYYNSGTFLVSLTVTGDGGVDIAQDAVITVYDQAIANFSVSPVVVFLPDQPIKCFNLSSNAYYSWWNFGDGSTSTETSPAHTYTQEGEYDISLKVCSEFYCCDSTEKLGEVSAKTSGEIVFPNAFAPNQSGPTGGAYNPNDNHNQIFFPISFGIAEYNLNIFNRWGELVFESDDVNIGWDGYYRDKLCKQDVYVWKVRGKFADGKEFVKVGDVTLLR